MFGSIPLSGVAAVLGGYLALTAQIGLAYEDMWLRARGEPLTIATWQLPAPETTRAVIMAHGIHQYRRQAFPATSRDLVAHLVRSGFTVLMLDLRGHSTSAPARMIYAILERREQLDAINWPLTHDYAPGTIGMRGAAIDGVAGSRELALEYGTPASRRTLSRDAAAPTAWVGAAVVLTKHLDDHETRAEISAARSAPIMPGYTHTTLERRSTAMATSDAALQDPSVSSISRIMALVMLGRLRARRGDPGVAEALDEALELAAQTNQLQRLAPVHAARAEAAWLAGNQVQLRSEARAIYTLASDKRHPWFTGELGFWRWRAGDQITPPPWMSRPFRLQIAGEWQRAADAWERVYCPYERAMALMDGDTAAQHQALDIFEQLGARPIAEIVRRKLHTIPQRERAAFDGLTKREQQLAALIAQGKSNREIAAAMTVGVKTVETYVTRILDKLGFDSRVQVATWVVAKALAPSLQHPEL